MHHGFGEQLFVPSLPQHLPPALCQLQQVHGRVLLLLLELLLVQSRRGSEPATLFLIISDGLSAANHLLADTFSA